MESNKITIELSKDEALVLFDLLARFNKIENKELFEDQAEQRVLWNLEASLEKLLTAPFLDDYLVFLSKAREAVRHKE
jgi:hypothetical protein